MTPVHLLESIQNVLQRYLLGQAKGNKVLSLYTEDAVQMHFSGGSTKLRKETTDFGMSVCPSVPPHGTSRPPLNRFSWFLVFEYFWKVGRENSILINFWEAKMVLYMKTYMHFWSYLTQFFLGWKMLKANIAETIKTHILWWKTILRKSCRLWENVEK